MVCSVVDALESSHHLTGYTHGVSKPKTDCKQFFQSLLDIGDPAIRHHRWQSSKNTSVVYPNHEFILFSDIKIWP